MKSLSKQSTLLIIFAIVAVLAVGVLAVQKSQQLPQNTVENEGNQGNSEKTNEQSIEEELVWYEIPELGVRFKVSPDTYEDLEYVVSSENNPSWTENGHVSAVFYKKSAIDFFGEVKCGAVEKGHLMCSNFILHRISNEQLQIIESDPDKGNVCAETYTLLKNENDVVCYVPPQAFNYTNKEWKEYLEYLKEQGIEYKYDLGKKFFNSIEIFR